jgi:hypothetical protein
VQGQHAAQKRAFLLVRVVARGGVEPPTFRFSVGRSYQLSYLAVRAVSDPRCVEATQTGLEPATFAVTGRRANQLRHWALLSCPQRDSNPRCRLERAES